MIEIIIMEDIELKKENLRKERYKFLYAFEKNMEVPTNSFSLAWTLLLPISIISGNKITVVLFFIAWSAIIIDFVIRVMVAPHRINYLRNNMLIIISVYMPFFRLYRIFYPLKNRRGQLPYYTNMSYKNKRRWTE